MLSVGGAFIVLAVCSLPSNLDAADCWAETAGLLAPSPFFMLFHSRDIDQEEDVPAYPLDDSTVLVRRDRLLSIEIGRRRNDIFDPMRDPP